MANAVVWTLLLTILIQITPINTVACFTCIDCGDPFNLQVSNATQTPSVCAYCYKLTVYVPYSPSRYIVKECVQTCTESLGSFGGTSVRVSCCDTSFCNGALKMYSSQTSFLVILSSLLILIHRTLQ